LNFKNTKSKVHTKISDDKKKIKSHLREGNKNKGTKK